MPSFAFDGLTRRLLRDALAAALATVFLWPGLAAAADAPPPPREDTEALAKAAQNPIANLISVPFQNNTGFNFGPRERTQNTLNIQPVVPFKLSDDWNLITRTIVPIVHQPSLVKGDSSDNGVGDINPTLFFATSLAKDLLVGFGPTFTLPTAASNELGSGKWSAGPAAVVVWTPGHWVAGVLANNQWSFAGDNDRADVNQMLIQPFVNYNIGEGWYLTSAPIVTANWEADRSKDTWTVPIGGGFGRLVRIGKLPVNMSVQAFDNVEKPEYGANWQLRLQVQFLFPE